MDDKQLGFLLDAAVPGAQPGPEALARIRRRATQRRQRMIGAAGLAAGLAIAGGAVGANAWFGGGGGSTVGPAQSTSPSTTVAVTTTSMLATVPTTPPTSTPPTTRLVTSTTRPAPTATTTTLRPHSGGVAACASPSDVTVTVDANFEGTAGTLHWPIVATNHSSTPCRLPGPITAEITDAHGAIIGAIPGNPAVQALPAAGFVDVLQPGAPTVVGHVGWSNPCSTGPVRIVVHGFAPPALLPLAQQTFCAGPLSTSHVQIERAQ